MQKGEPKMRAVHFSMVCDSRMWNASGETCMCGKKKRRAGCFGLIDRKKRSAGIIFAVNLLFFFVDIKERIRTEWLNMK